MNAIILAGGRGTRLEPWHAPKCLMPINGVSILQRLLDHLFDQQELVSRAIICTGYRFKDIESALEAHGWLGDHVLCSKDTVDARMGERLIAARKLTDGGRALICYADELIDLDVATLLLAHAANHMTFVSCAQRVTGGVVEHSNTHLCINEEGTVDVNVGFVVVEAACWQLLTPDDGLSGWINKVSSHPEMVVGRFRHVGKRTTVNSLADLRAAEEAWR